MSEKRKINFGNIAVVIVAIILMFLIAKGCATGDGTNVGFGCSKSTQNTAVVDSTVTDSTLVDITPVDTVIIK